MLLTLQRKSTGDEGTFGILTFGPHVVYTGELPWRSNEPSWSCIPSGLYELALQFSPRFGKKLYCLQSVAGRDSILIHAANWMGDEDKGLMCELEGCIALGSSVGIVENNKVKPSRSQKGLSGSRAAVDLFMSFMKGQNLMLQIMDITGQPMTVPIKG